MQFLVFSDSHGNCFPMIRVIREHPDIRHILFLGDGLADIGELVALFPTHVFLAVRGNTDGLTPDHEDEIAFDLFGSRVLLMHGHRAQVKGGLDVAVQMAKDAHARVLLYGHTHMPDNRYLPEEELYVFNPGSIGRAYTGRVTYGLLDILKTGGIVLSHGQL